MELPILASYLSDVSKGKWPSRRQAFLTAVAKAEAGHAAGAIANPIYKDAKETINRAIETATAAINAVHINGRWLDLPAEVQGFERQVDGVYLHTVAGKLRKAESLKVDHPYCTDLTALLRDVAPLATMMEALKGMTVKRQPKQERLPGYHPPQVSSEIQRQVVALLEQITEASYDLLRTTIRNMYGRWLADYLAVAAIAQEHGESLSAYDYFMRRRFPHSDYYAVVSLALTGKDTCKPNWKALFETKATETADEIREHFVHKNFRKIASVIEGKGSYVSGQAISHSVDMAGLTGTLEFRFDDGSSFLARNQVVFVRNRFGTAFNRFPLTFHNVKMPGGKPMAAPSEKRMNTTFLGKSR